MKKRLLSAVLALVLCAYPAMAADFGTLTISSDREVIDDSVLYELAETDEPSTLTLRTPNGETGSLMFDGTDGNETISLILKMNIGRFSKSVQYHKSCVVPGAGVFR